MRAHYKAIIYAKRLMSRPYTDSMSKLEKEWWTMEFDTYYYDYMDASRETRKMMYTNSKIAKKNNHG